jgi:hypothetical protein
MLRWGVPPDLSQKCHKAILELPGVVQLAFPYHLDRPATFPQLLDVHKISRSIAREFCFPETVVSFGNTCSWAIRVRMPKTAVNEHNSLPSGKD